MFLLSMSCNNDDDLMMTLRVSLQIGDEGAEAIAKLLKMDTALYQLALINCSIGEIGVFARVLTLLIVYSVFLCAFFVGTFRYALKQSLFSEFILFLPLIERDNS